MVYIAVALAIVAMAFVRRNRLDHDFADKYRPLPPASTAPDAAASSRLLAPPDDVAATPPASPTRATAGRLALASSWSKLKRSLSPSRPSFHPAPTPPPPPQQRIWGREFRTSGDAVVLLTLAVGALQVTLIVLLARLS